MMFFKSSALFFTHVKKLVMNFGSLGSTGGSDAGAVGSSLFGSVLGAVGGSVGAAVVAERIKQ